MTDPVTVQYFKYPDTLHWRHDLHLLGEDDHGVWLGGEQGTTLQRGTEPVIALEAPLVQLVGPGRSWSAIFRPSEIDVEVYVDVITPARWVDRGRVEMIDLDLDVIRRRNGAVYVDDEDEFEEHRRTLAYPPHMVDTARTTAARMVLALELGRPPFDGTAAGWLDRVGS